MCDLPSHANEAGVSSVSRRRLLGGAGAVALGAGLAAAGGTASAAAAPAANANANANGNGNGNGAKHRTRLVLLGTGGGPIVLSGHRNGIATAVVYEDKVYVVDLGHGAPLQLYRSGLLGDPSDLGKVRGIFFTHMHSDHVAEWPALYATGPVNGRLRNPQDRIHVFGPGDRPVPARVFPPTRPEPEPVNPGGPISGISEMTRCLRPAFAADFEDRIRDSNMVDPDAMFALHDIDISPYWTVDASGIPPRLPAGTRIPVWRDGDVTITATLVDHRPTAPAFAFRFDTPDGSVVVSGDTGPSENLIDLAKDTDYLVHEVIDPRYVDQMVATLPEATQAPVRQHLLESHTTIEQVGRDVAERAGARNLVLTHMVPMNNPVSRWRTAQKGYGGKLIVGEDLMELGVGKRRR
ncbi:MULTISPECIES: MBL fold metallo-hydrolase [unclassified Streptomyces]|uniref:MBL fold metallo-hydrolase n=1 Tax=unclassified Streptomyces TaxID=2593676 RepID=UPI00166056D3|nr:MULTISPECIES: MBL fold metallo-hydrolase [unclassified Streptomyces]MBD0711826.1 hydrolase [Streptomyces sp. CBMA291]MBD0714646.1 hydrolase [Streptomyces sp. CBMA370]